MGTLRGTVYFVVQLTREDCFGAAEAPRCGYSGTSRENMSHENNQKRVAIAGAGMTGAYLFRLLSGAGFCAAIYDVAPRTQCGLTPCAWGTSRGFAELVEACGLNPQKYILKRLDRVLIDQVTVPADLMTFDKPALIGDLLFGAEIKRPPVDASMYDRVIDATGVARAFLPKIDDDIILRCVQRRIASPYPLENRIRLGSIGYAWCFPLAEDCYHIGCGSLIADPGAILDNLRWTSGRVSGNPRSLICACTGKIRVTGPHRSQPFVVDGASGTVWGVGEAIGCVAPLAGDGIVPGMRSVRILLDNWDDPQAYSKAILKEFDWMKSERVVIDKLRDSKRLGFRDGLVLKYNSKRMGMQVGIRDAVLLLKNLA